ncbi:hypothetical protein LY76DRAFT_15493 [Colletotrichum caudatum]|nr:hypothetical protein LY76DRAFT_15493 [Colletotrichum caudatum]
MGARGYVFTPRSVTLFHGASSTPSSPITDKQDAEFTWQCVRMRAPKGRGVRVVGGTARGNGPWTKVKPNRRALSASETLDRGRCSRQAMRMAGTMRESHRKGQIWRETTSAEMDGPSVIEFGMLSGRLPGTNGFAGASPALLSRPLPLLFRRGMNGRPQS